LQSFPKKCWVINSPLTGSGPSVYCLVHTICLTKRIPQAMNIHLILSIVNSCTFCTILAAASYLQIGFSHNSQSHRKIESCISTTSISQYTKDGGWIYHHYTKPRENSSVSTKLNQTSQHQLSCLHRWRFRMKGGKDGKSSMFWVLPSGVVGLTCSISEMK